MTHQVALSREAYASLRRAKRPGESFSRTVLRLLETAAASKSDPGAFARRKRAFLLDQAEHELESQAGRAGEDAWHAGA